MRRLFKATGELDEEELARPETPDEIVTKRTREYMLKTGEKDFAVAKRVVLKADLDLAYQYTKVELP